MDQTALRTQAGTFSFSAPEVRGLIRAPTATYTHAVDIWSLGIIAYLMITGESLFEDPHLLSEYIAGNFEFPIHPLFDQVEGRDFIKCLLAPKPEDRPKTKECLEHPWLRELVKSKGIETQW